MRAAWKAITMLAVAAMIGAPSAARADEDGKAKYAERLTESTQAFQELTSSSDHKVPEKLMRNAKCVVVIPGMVKGALGFGARLGNGVMSCRDSRGSWSAPVFVDLKGGSWGLQIGAQKTDLVLFFMTEKGARSLVNKSKFTLGGSASIAAGPMGRSGEADTDLHLNAEIYSYAKSKGLFAGISLEGANLKISDKANGIYWGAKVSPRGILFASKEPQMPPEARDFVAVLPRY